MRCGFCRAQVYGDRDPRGHRCSRRAVKDGYCKQHHPDTVKAREDARSAKWLAECQAVKDREEAEEAAIVARIDTAVTDFREACLEIVERNVCDGTCAHGGHHRARETAELIRELPLRATK